MNEFAGGWAVIVATPQQSPAHVCVGGGKRVVNKHEPRRAQARNTQRRDIATNTRAKGS